MRRVTIFLFTMVLMVPGLLIAESSGVVIERFQISSENGSNDEYVTIYNTGSGNVDISGWKLAKKSASLSASPVYLRTSIPDGTVLGPSQKLVLAHPDCSCAFDMPYATSTGSTPGSGIAADNTIILFNKEKTVIDKVGFGRAADFEGTATPVSPEVGEVYARKANGQDTDNNKADFYLAYSPPKEEPAKEGDDTEESAEFSESTVGAKLKVSEFIINPEGIDKDGEWIEVYNAGDDAVIGGYVIADRLGSPKKYTFPKGTKIKARQYLAFYSGKTPISLNNDGDAVEIRNPAGDVIDFSPNSGKGDEGLSFAKDGAKWSWTKTPTPGKANIIVAPEEDSDKATDKSVLSLVDENSLPTAEDVVRAEREKRNDQLLGYALIALATVLGIFYTLYINKEKLREYYFKYFRSRNNKIGSKIWQHFKRR